MGAPELLHHLRGAGLVLTLTPAGALHVAPRSGLTDDHRAAIRAERDALVLALNAEAATLPPAPRRRWRWVMHWRSPCWMPGIFAKKTLPARTRAARWAGACSPTSRT